ncbi:MAG: LPS export ABC transporter periplasmic protein LptC [Elusimicrobiota bacterium]
MKKFFLISILFLFSCNRNKDEIFISKNTFIKKLSIDHIKDNEKRWTLFCDNAIVDEEKNFFKCYKTKIKVYKDNKIASIITSETGYGDISVNSFYLKNNCQIISYLENIDLLTQTINFDSKNEKIYSKDITKILRKKENIEIISKGFEAKSDLSNIKFFNHTTHMINSNLHDIKPKI